MKRSSFRTARRHALIESLEHRQLFAFGNADVTFGLAGRVTAGIKNQPTTHLVEDLSTLANGKIVAGGDAGLVRFNADGTADNTYGASGRVRIRGFNFKAQAVNSTGTAYVLGTGAAGVLVAKFTSSGALDASYATVGTALVAGPKVGFKPAAIALQTDGKIMVAGNLPAKDNSQKVRLYRLNTNGTLDDSFSSDGFVDLTLGKASLFTPLLTDRLTGITVLGDGKILIAGGSISFAPGADDGEGGYINPVNGDAVAIVARLNSDGTVDSSYGASGFRRYVYADADTVDSAVGFNRNDVLPTASAFRSDGTVAIGAFDERAIVLTFDAGGGSPGAARPDLGSPLRKAPIDLTFLNDGRVVYLTYAATRSDLGMVMATVTAQTNFGTEIYTANAPTDDLADLANTRAAALGVAGDGKLLVGGKSDLQNEFEILKYSPGKDNDPRPDEFANGTINSIKQGNDGSLHVAYYDSVSNNLKYVYRAPNGLWNAPVTVDSSAGVGTYVSIYTTKEFQPVIAYFDSTAADLKLARTANFGKNWELQTVASKGSVGQYPSLFIDSKNRPTLTFYNKTTGDLVFGQLKKNAAGTEKWGFETIDAVGDVGRESTLVVSANTGRYTVAYYDFTNKDIKWAAQNSGGEWEVQKAAHAPGARYLSMGYSFDIAPAISYYDPVNADLNLVYFTENKWKAKVVAAEQAQGQWSKVQFANTYGDPTLFAYNKSGNRVSRYSRVFDTPSVTTAASPGGENLSVDFVREINVFAYVETGSSGNLVVRYGPSPVG